MKKTSTKKTSTKKTEEPSIAWKIKIWEDVPHKHLLMMYLFWYYQNTADFPFKSTQVENTHLHDYLIRQGLLDIERKPDSPSFEDYYKLTEKGERFVQHLLDQPLPVSRTIWSMPEL